MSEETIIFVEEEPTPATAEVSPADTSRRVVLAGIGIIVLFRGEMKARVNQLIERGEATLDRDNRPTLPAARPALRRRLQSPVNALLHRFNVPTHADIDALNQQVTTLLEKVETLQAQTLIPTQTTNDPPPAD